MLLYDLWYRQYGIRRASDLMKPVLKPISLLSFPRSSTYFYPGQGVNDSGPSSNDALFKDVTRLIFMHHVTDLTRFEGNPRIAPFNFATAIRDYHLTNKRFRRALDVAQGLRDEVPPFVVNFAMLDRRYRYMRSMFSELHTWRNKFGTMMDTVAEFTTISDRHCFVMFDIPEHLPGLTFLKVACEDHIAEALEVAPTWPSANDVVTESADRAIMTTWYKANVRKAIENYMAKHATDQGTVAFLNNPAVENYDGSVSLGRQVAVEKMTTSIMKYFNTHESLAMLEVWKWLGDKRSSSLMSKIPEEHFHKVNLIFKDGNKFITINLAVINAWRSKPENPNNQLLKPYQLQIRFLRMFMSMVDERNGGPLEDKLDGTADAKLVDPNTKVDESAIVDDVVTDENGTLVTSPNIVDTNTGELDALFDTSVDISIDESQDAILEKEINDLSAIMQHIRDATASEVEAAIFSREEKPVEAGVKAKCDALSNFGTISSKDHAKYQDLAQSYKSIPIPDVFNMGVGTLSDLMHVDPELLKVDSKPIPDSPTVLDKSMLQRPLSNFHSKYIQNVLPRNIAGCVMNLQRAGICVTDYNVERHEDISGAFDAYAVRVVPVEGAASTLRFRIPVLDDEGTFTAGGTKYRLRMQRGD